MASAPGEKKPTRRQLVHVRAGAGCLALAGADCLVAARGTAPLFPAVTKNAAAVRSTQLTDMALGRNASPGQPDPATRPGGCAAARSATAPYSPGEVVSLKGGNWTATWWSTGSRPGAALFSRDWSGGGRC
jgi:hypothetical protein